MVIIEVLYQQVHFEGLKKMKKIYFMHLPRTDVS